MLELTGVSVALRSQQILRNVSLTVRPGSLMALVGPNGAGKSTLMRAALGLVPLHAGQVRLEGHVLDGIPASERARKLAYLAQGHHAVWPIRARRLIELGRLPHRDWSRPDARDGAIIEEVMARCGVSELAERKINTLSGGEKARVMLARALAVGAEVLLADEPIAALDPRHQLEVMTQLRTLSDRGIAVLCVLHDLQIAARFCDQIAVLADGALVEFGPPEAALAPPIIRQTFGVDVVTMDIKGEQVLIPWSVSAAG